MSVKTKCYTILWLPAAEGPSCHGCAHRHRDCGHVHHRGAYGRRIHSCNAESSQLSSVSKTFFHTLSGADCKTRLRPANRDPQKKTQIFGAGISKVPNNDCFPGTGGGGTEPVARVADILQQVFLQTAVKSESGRCHTSQTVCLSTLLLCTLSPV